jgi:hypothetical protein
VAVNVTGWPKAAELADDVTLRLVGALSDRILIRNASLLPPA